MGTCQWNLGVELWAVQIVAELKEEYPELSLGILYPFLILVITGMKEPRKTISRTISRLCRSC